MPPPGTWNNVAHTTAATHGALGLWRKSLFLPAMSKPFYLEGRKFHLSERQLEFYFLFFLGRDILFIVTLINNLMATS
jgi:hypothetical protein